MAIYRVRVCEHIDQRLPTRKAPLCKGSSAVGGEGLFPTLLNEIQSLSLAPQSSSPSCSQLVNNGSLFSKCRFATFAQVARNFGSLFHQ